MEIYVTRTNVAWTNVTVTVGICSRGSQVPTFKNVKIGSVTAEIFLIWTNVTWANVAWTNVTMTVRFYSRCCQEATFKVSLKSGQ